MKTNEFNARVKSASVQHRPFKGRTIILASEIGIATDFQFPSLLLSKNK